jgi:hypothetical protein
MLSPVADGRDAGAAHYAAMVSIFLDLINAVEIVTDRQQSQIPCGFSPSRLRRFTQQAPFLGRQSMLYKSSYPS